MAVVSQSIPNFLNGISQQTPTQRGINQGEEQINCQNNIIKGLGKRPPSEYIATLDATNVFPNTTKIWSIQRDENNKYMAAFYNGGVRVFDLQGNEKTVSYPDGTSYLTTTNPKNDLKMVNIADYTFVSNKSITPAQSGTTTAAKEEYFYVVFKVTNFGREYAIHLTHPDLPYGINAIIQMPDGSDANHDTQFRDTAKLIDIFRYGTSSTYWDASSSIEFKLTRNDTGATLTTTQGLSSYSAITAKFTFTEHQSALRGYVVDQNASYTVETHDGAGNAELYAVKDEIQDFTKLPYYAKLDDKIKVTGDAGDTTSDYYVNYVGNGVWEECIAPNTSTGLNDATMPHALINNNDGTFTFAKQSYTERDAGDDTTNPDPTFVGQKIQNLTFYKNRLGILAGENLILSGNADYFNFFGTTVTQVLDTDVIDVAASGTTVNVLRNSISFNETLLLFSDTSQYKLASAAETITPTSAVLNEVSTFSHNANVTPVSSGRYAYFSQVRNANTAVREYYSDNDTLTNDGLDVTVAVQTLIPDNAYSILSNTTEDSLIVLCSDTADTQTAPYTTGTAVSPTNANTMYMYKYFFDRGEKVQTAWSKWQLDNVKIIGGMIDRSFVYLFVAEETDTKLLRIDLQDLADSTIGHNVYLDLKKAVTGTYDSATDKTTFTSPYGAKTGLLAVNASTGADYTATNTSGSTYTIEGDHTNLIIGVPYESKYTLSPQYVRESSGQGSIAVTSGRYQIRTISFDYENSGFFQVEVTPENRDTYTTFMNGYIIGLSGAVDNPAISSGTIIVPVQSRNTLFTLDIKSSSHLPMFIPSAEVEGYYHRRSRRI
jgi:hypothetical protein